MKYRVAGEIHDTATRAAIAATGPMEWLQPSQRIRQLNPGDMLLINDKVVTALSGEVYAYPSK